MRENTIWTAIPAGMAAGGKVKLSAHVSIHLTGDAATTTLSMFHVATWKPEQFKFQVFVDGKEIPGVQVTSAVEPGLWANYFPANGPVTSFGYVPQAPRPIETFHATAVGSMLTELHAGHVASGFQASLTIQDYASNKIIGAANVFGPKGSGAVNSGFKQASGTKIVATGPSALNNKFQSDSRFGAIAKARQLGSMPTELDHVVFEAAAFFRPFVVPKNITPKRPEIDFHTALALLGQHPELMRKVGVVFDLTLDAKDIPTAGQISLKVSNTGVPPEGHVYPKTVFVHDDDFRAATQASATSDILNGYLDMNPTKISVGTLDLNGGLSKVMDFSEKLFQTMANMTVTENNSSKIFMPVLSFESTDAATESSTDTQLPTGRTSGISVYRINRAAQLTALRGRSDLMNTKAATNDIVLYADDLHKGWRPDIKHNDKWFSLTARHNVYRIGSSVIETQDEGQVLTGFTKSPDKSGADRLHESLLSWNGWSVVARKPGRPMKDDGTLETEFPQTKDGFLAWSNNPTNLDAHYRMAAFASATPGSLPTLRFGESYSIRARAVDLAGNSLPLMPVSYVQNGGRVLAGTSTKPGGKMEVLPSQTTSYLRHEPILAPTLHLTKPLVERGDSSNILVIRKYVKQPPGPNDSRHLLPPEGGVSYAELHGKLDAPSGAPDPAKWAMLSTVDQRPALPAVIDAATVPPLPYLPDPTAMGATLRVLSNYALPTARVAYYTGSPWPNPACGKLVVTPATSTAASMQTSGSTITVGLLPGQALTMALSSNTTNEWLGDFNQTWAMEAALNADGQSMISLIQVSSPKAANRMKKFVDHKPYRYTPTMKTAGARTPITKSGGEAKAFPVVRGVDTVHQQFIDGANRAFTPYRTVKVIHATQVPEPGFTVSALFASRELGKTYSHFTFRGMVHNWSTQEVEFFADFVDPIDDLSEAKRTTKSLTHHVRPFAQDIAVTDATAITPLSAQGTYEFNDTKAHIMHFRMVLKSRYAQFFPQEWPLAGDKSTALTVDVDYAPPVVINAARRPDPLAVEYMMPAFTWTLKDAGTKRKSARKGNQVRVYLRRPWFTTGVDEALAVVMLHNATSNDELYHHTTILGADPAFNAAAIVGLPVSAQFPNRDGEAKGLSVPGLDDVLADIVYFKPQFDDVKQLWYVDIQITPTNGAYRPFVRLALARYQPHSNQGQELGRLSVTDITQLQPDRVAIVETVEPKKRIRVTMAGEQVSSSTGNNVVLGTLQERAGTDPDAGWVNVKNANGDDILFNVPYVSPSTAGEPALFQSFGAPQDPAFKALPNVNMQGKVAMDAQFGYVNLPSPTKTYRVVFAEYEVMTSTTPYLEIKPAGRLIHADTIEL